MDLNPDEAIAAGWLRHDSALARLLQRMLRYCVNNAPQSDRSRSILLSAAAGQRRRR